jgi:hypothetical protein
VKLTRNCDFCQEPYEADSRYLARNQGRYCDRSCSAKGNAADRANLVEPNVSCAYCNEPFYKSPSRVSQSKSGLVFCCREHKDLAQRLDGIKEIHPDHYGVEFGVKYRETAAKHLDMSHCSKCGYDRHPEILEVNHIDCNRKNNRIENLEVLCPNCHREFHFLTQTGHWWNAKKFSARSGRGASPCS